MSFDDGGAYALLGPSGCGKTTMLNIVSGLITPSHGTVKFDGVDVTDQTPQQRNIAQVFQFPVIYDTMTVAQNLAFPLRNRGVAPDKIKQRVDAIAVGGHVLRGASHPSLAEAGDFTLGVRPEYVGLAAPNQPDALPAKVQKSQDIGTYQLVTATSGDALIRARLSPEAKTPQPG